MTEATKRMCWTAMLLTIGGAGTGCASFLSDPLPASGQPTYGGIAPEEQDSRAEAERERADRVRRQIRHAVAEGDVVLGMEMGDVVSVWGQPRKVEAAGDPSSGNQRWFYFEGLSSPWSFSGARIVYFESGRVVGWETHQP